MVTTSAMTGGAIFEHDGTAIYWLGPGAGLFLIFGTSLVRIEHPTADGYYFTLATAREAATAFFAA